MKTNKDIWNELKEISPLLFQMRKDAGNPFKVPNDYFGALKDDIFRAIDTGLADQIGKQAFAVPENYFEHLSANIMERIEAEEVVETNTGGRVLDLQTHRRRGSFSFRRMSVMAASVAIFLLMGIFTARFFLQDNVGDPGLAITDEEAYEYLEENFADLESEDLIALVDFSSEDAAPAMTHGGGDIEDELEQYLEDHIDELDIDLLTNEI